MCKLKNGEFVSMRKLVKVMSNCDDEFSLLFSFVFRVIMWTVPTLNINAFYASLIVVK